jgi:hypothetical protein
MFKTALKDVRGTIQNMGWLTWIKMGWLAYPTHEVCDSHDDDDDDDDNAMCVCVCVCVCVWERERERERERTCEEFVVVRI